MQKYKGYFLLLIITILLIIMIITSDKQLNEYSHNLFYMDTYINVKVYSNNKIKAKKVLNEVEKIYEKYHQLTDRYHAYDNIKNIYYINNNTDNIETITIEKELYDIIKYGIDFYEKSNGLLNINIGNVIDVWKKYRESKNGVPTYEELKSSGSINVSDIVLLDNNQILNNHPNIDLGAIAKGYVTQIVGNYLKEQGFNKFLIYAGGNVLVGDHYKNDVYKIGIENPTKSGDIYKIVKSNNMAVVTSGGYERFYEYEGNIYHHIIDPNTLMPPNYMKSVTVITNDSALGDALSTTLFLMSIEEGKEYIKQFNNVEAIWYTNDNTIIKSDGFDKYE
ncbi:MAG: FAD:protein FMN transferase [Mollicutes bacterium]|nr:FAD:protein FMN transferase [Mollicutes bacterium]